MGSQPTPPSPQQNLAAATDVGNSQQGFNVASQAGSQYNQSNPYGSLSYQQTGTGPGGVPIYSANTSLSPIEQQLFGQYTGTQAQAGGQAASDLGFGNYGSISPTQQIGSMTSGTTGQLENAYLGSVEPFFQTQQQQLDTQLQNQGLTATTPTSSAPNPNGPTASGNPAYNNAMRQLMTSQDQAALGAAAQFEPQAFSQASNLYSLPLTTSEQLAQWGAPQGPQSMFTNQLPSLGSTNLVGADQAVGQQAQNQFGDAQGQYTAMIQALSGGAGTLGSALGGNGMFGANGAFGAGGALSGFGSGLSGLFGAGSASAGATGAAADLLPLALA